MTIYSAAVPITVAALIVLAGSATAQVTIEARGGAAIGNHVPAAAGFQTRPGPAFSASLEGRVQRRISAYATYLRASFPCEGGFCGDGNVTVTADGFGGGIVAYAGSYPWIRVGALYYGTTVRPEGDPGSTDSALGYELAGGVSIPIFGSISIAPGVYLRSQTGDLRTTLIGGDLGLRISFGAH
jgi:hypothetical protein